MKHWVILAGMVLAGCVPTAQTPEQLAAAAEVAAYHPPSPGFPPKMGSISGMLDGKAVAWETFDFSVGAYDASAWVGFQDGVQTLHLRGMQPGNSDSKAGNIVIRGDIAGARVPGALSGVQVSVQQGDDWRGPAFSSQGQVASLAINAIDAPALDKSGYGRASGTVTATLCPVAGAKGACQKFTAVFNTEVQFDSTQFETAQ